MKGTVGGLVLVTVGTLLLARNLGWVSLESLVKYWPVILIVVGLSLLIGKGRG